MYLRSGLYLPHIGSFYRSRALGKNRLLAFVLALGFGFWGLDRFYLGHLGLGLLKVSLTTLFATLYVIYRMKLSGFTSLFGDDMMTFTLLLILVPLLAVNVGLWWTDIIRIATRKISL